MEVDLLIFFFLDSWLLLNVSSAPPLPPGLEGGVGWGEKGQEKTPREQEGTFQRPLYHSFGKMGVWPRFPRKRPRLTRATPAFPP